MWQFMLTHIPLFPSNTHINIYTIYHCFPNEKQLNSWLQPPNILKTTHTPQKICLPLRYFFTPSTLFFLVNTIKDTYASPSSKHWNLTPHHFWENGFNMVNPLDSSQSSFYLWRFLLSTSFFKMTIFYFFHVYDYSFFLLVQLLVLQMQVLSEVPSLDFFLSQQFCLDEPAYSSGLKRHLCTASF